MPVLLNEELPCAECGEVLGWGEGDFNCTTMVCPKCLASKYRKIPDPYPYFGRSEDGVYEKLEAPCATNTP